MRKLHALLPLLALTLAVEAQTLNVVTDNVTYQFPAAQAGDMAYANGTTLTIMGKTFALTDIDKMYIDATAVTDNEVAITYSGTTATVTVAGNVAAYVAPTLSGAHVSIEQSNTADVDGDEITYTLSGTTTDGEFYLKGSYKCTVDLNGVTLTNTNPVYSGAALHIQNGKRINISVKKDTENTLRDCSSPTTALAQKACLYVKGHAEFKGKGILNVYGNYKHGIKTGEYMTQKNCTLNVAVTAAAAKGIKADEDLTVTSGTLNVTTTGGGAYDSDDQDAKGAAAISSDANITIADGTLTLKSSGAGGKCHKCDSLLTISGGTLTATATGTTYKYSSTLTASAKAIKAGIRTGTSRNNYTYAGGIVITGGTLTATATSHEAIESKSTIDISGGQVYAYSSDDAINSASTFTISGGYVMGNSTGNDGLDANGNFHITGGTVFAIAATSPEVGIDANTEDGYKLYVTGGTIIAIGGLESGSSLTQSCYQASTYSKGTWYALYTDGTPTLAFQVPSNSRMGTPLVVSTPGTPTLQSSVTPTGGTTIWNNYATLDATLTGGTTVALTSYTGGNNGGGPGGGGGRPTR